MSVDKRFFSVSFFHCPSDPRFSRLEGRYDLHAPFSTSQRESGRSPHGDSASHVEPLHPMPAHR